MIRDAVAEDCGTLAELDRQCNPAPWSAQQFQTALNSRFDTVKVLEHQAATAGFAVWQTICGESELHLIGIDPAVRRNGLASQLMNAWFQTASSEAIERWFLEVRASNHAARALYEQYGFREYGRRKDYYPLPNGGREDAVLMEKKC